MFDAIRKDTPYNESERCAYAAMTGILGRMAAESGQLITWEEAMASDLQLAPGLDQMHHAVAAAGQGQRRRELPDRAAWYDQGVLTLRARNRRFPSA